MQVALSVKQGTVSSVTLLRRLNNRPALREQIQKATNKAEAYNPALDASC